MKRLSSVLAVLVIAAGCGPAPASPADVEATMESFYAAMGRGDAAGAMALIAPDAVFVESGRLETRAQYEESHLPADIAFEKQVKGKRDTWQITIEGDTAWAIAETEFDGTFDGAPLHFFSSQLAVLTREDEGWRIRSVHWSSRRP